jgi:predicted dehydrogenase
LVEKSFARDYQSARSLCALAREKKRLVMENFPFPLHAQHGRVNDLLSRGAIGELRLLRSTFGFPPLSPGNFRYDRELGGGALLDAGAYVLKVSTLFMGWNLTLLGAALRYDATRRVDVGGSAMLRNTCGLVAQVAFGFDHYYQCCYELLGAKGRIVVGRAFTAPPGFAPSIRLEQQDLKQTFLVPPDNQYLNMVSFFAAEVAGNRNFAAHWDGLEQQAKLLDMVQKEALNV